MPASPNNGVHASDAHDPIKGSDLDKDSMEAPDLQRRSADAGTAAASGWAFGRMFRPASHRSDGAAQQLGSEGGGAPGWAMGRMFRPASHRSTEAGASQEGGGQHLSGGGAGIWAGGRLYRPGSHRSMCSVMSMESEHVTRLAQHELELLEERVVALEHHALAPLPEEKQPAGSPLKEFLRNFWVLAIMAGIVGIIVAAKGRIHAPEPLQGVHACNGVIPYVMPLGNSSVDYLFVNILIGPYYPPDQANSSSSSSSGGHRRRLASWVGESLSQRQGVSTTSSSGSGSGSSGSNGSSHGGFPGSGGGSAYMAMQAQFELAQGVRQLLAKPRLGLARSGEERAGMGQHRRLLAADSVEEPSNDEVDPNLPELKVMLLQLNPNASSGAEDLLASASQGLFLPVSDSQFCTTKEGAAVKCSLDFRGGDLTDAYIEGAPLYLGFESTQAAQLVFKVEASELGALGPAKNWIALAILGVVLLGIASEKIHRMWCAMIGAAAMMAILLWMNMAPALGTVVAWLDESTLGLLFGMMAIVGRLSETGMFEVLSAWTVRASKGRMWQLSSMLMVVTAFLSAWLDNVTTMLLMAPVTVSMMRQCNTDPVPLLIAQVLMSNIGGAATMVGDPPALIIGTALSNYLGFLDFIVNMAPGVIMATAACLPLILWLNRRTLMGAINNYEAVLKEVQSFRITNWNLMAKCTYVTGAVLVGFLLHPVHHVDPAWFAVLGAIVLCVCDAPMEVEKVVRSVEWDMLLFFAAMFVMIEASAEIGMIGMAAGWLESIIESTPEGSRTIVAIQILLWLSAFISALLDNIPYTITMVPIIEYLAFSNLGLDLATLAWALNFGACFGGNATLIGASANIVTATLAERAGYSVTFMGWLKMGVPIMLVSVAMADVWMILRFCL